MVLGVMLGRFVAVMGRMQRMRVRDMRVMSGLFMVAGGVMLGGLAMMVSSVLVMLGSGLVVVAALVALAHDVLLFLRYADRHQTGTKI